MDNDIQNIEHAKIKINKENLDTIFDYLENVIFSQPTTLSVLPRGENTITIFRVLDKFEMAFELEDKLYHDTIKEIRVNLGFLINTKMEDVDNIFVQLKSVKNILSDVKETIDKPIVNKEVKIKKINLLTKIKGYLWK